MNIDQLQCKRDAQDLVASSDAPRNRNGRKKRYIEVMAELWDEISQWCKNTFLVPYSKTGRDFTDKLTEHINDWNNGAEGQHVSLKAAIVLLAVGLQKPSRKSKAKDHQECLAKHLALWKEGDIDSLLHYSDWVCTEVMSNDVMKDLRG